MSDSFFDATPALDSDEKAITALVKGLTAAAGPLVDNMTYKNFIVGMSRFYLSNLLVVVQQPDFPVESMAELRDMILGWLAHEMSQYEAFARQSKETEIPTHPMVGRLGYVIGSEENGLLDRHNQKFVIVDVVKLPEDQTVYVVHFVTDDARGKLMNDDFCLIEDDEVPPDVY